jgi:hypothetical protein
MVVLTVFLDFGKSVIPWWQRLSRPKIRKGGGRASKACPTEMT